VSTLPSVRPPLQGLLEWLDGHDVTYELHEHAATVTARETARVEHVDPHTFAKTLAVTTDDGRRALLVVEASDMLDLLKAARALGARHARLLTEPEMEDLAPTCDLGTIPPIGALCGLPVVADHAIRDDEWLSFHAGSHRHSVRVEREAWETAAGVTYADLAEEQDARPRWAWS
jgi:Ala-tRNA(Pro) deacylase